MITLKKKEKQKQKTNVKCNPATKMLPINKKQKREMKKK